MNAARVNNVAGVILAAQKTRQTAAGIAMALEAACLLQSPESAAELVALHERVAELEAEQGARQQTQDWFAALSLDELQQAVSQWRADGSPGVAPGHPAPCRWPASPDCLCPPTPPRGLRPGADAARRMIRDRQTGEDPHDSPLHHTYTTGRDLPEVTS